MADTNASSTNASSARKGIPEERKAALVKPDKMARGRHTSVSLLVKSARSTFPKLSFWGPGSNLQCLGNVPPGFFEELEKAELPQELVDYVCAEHIYDLGDLPTYCLQKGDIFKDLVERVAACKREKRYQVALCRLWDVATASTAQEVKQRVEGVGDESLEVPLSAEEVEVWNGRHAAAYGYKLSPFELLCGHTCLAASSAS